MLQKWFLVGLAGFCIATTVATAQDCNHVLQGQVLDQAGQPLADAIVHLHGTRLGLETKADGSFRITGLCAGSYELHVSYIGYKQHSVQVRVPHMGRLLLQLQEDSIRVSTIEIVQRQPSTTGGPGVAVSGAQLAQVQGRSLAEAIASVPGVSLLRTGANIVKPVIRGLHGNRVLVLNNGVRQEGQQWGAEHAPEIDPFIAKKISVLRGAAALRYGADAIAGLVLVEPDTLRHRRGYGAELNLAGFDNGRAGAASALVQAGYRNGLAWRLQGTLRQGGDVRSPSYYLNNTGVQERNASATLGWQRGGWQAQAYFSYFNTRIGILQAAHIGNLSDLQTVLDNGQPLTTADFSYAINRPYQQVQHYLGKLSLQRSSTHLGTLALHYAVQVNQRSEYDAHRPFNDSLEQLNRPQLYFEIATHSAELLWQHQHRAGWRSQAGLTALVQYNSYEGRFLIPFYDSYGWGAFVSSEVLLGRWLLEAGLRYDFRQYDMLLARGVRLASPRYSLEPQQQFGGLSGTLGAVYHVAERSTLRWNSTLAWRPPVANELYSSGVHHATGTIEYGLLTDSQGGIISQSNTARPEQALNNSLTFTKTQGGRWWGQVSAYGNFISDFIYQRPVLPYALTIRGAFPVYRTSQVDATLYGLDYSLNVRVRGGLSLGTRGALLRAWNRTAAEWLVLMPADRLEQVLRYDLPNKGALQQAFVQLVQTSVLTQTRAPEGQDYAPPPAAYGLWQLELGTGLRLGARQRMLLSLTVSNLFDTAYRDYLNRWRYYAHEMGRNVQLRIQIPLDFTLPS